MDNEKKSKSAMSDEDAISKAMDIYQALLTKQQSILLATVNADGTPLASYTPFAVDADKNFYIFVSTLAHHTKNLQRSPHASLMVIADEIESMQIFARERLTFSCQIEELERESPDWEDAAVLYEARFGNFFKLIKGFNDFKMFKLVPKDGMLVVGFGQAYTLEGDTLDTLTLRQE